MAAKRESEAAYVPDKSDRGASVQTGTGAKIEQLEQPTTGALAIRQFEFEGRGLRTLISNRRHWFVGVDVCRPVGLKAHKGSYAHHFLKLDADEKMQVSRAEFLAWSEDPTLNVGCQISADAAETDGNTGVWVVSESGLYTLILRSRAATTPGTAAHRFRRWVTRDVLPSIRETGQYGAPTNTYGFRAPDTDLPGRYVSLLGRDGKWRHYWSPFATIRNDMDAEDARTLAHGIKVIQGFWHKLQPLHGDRPELLEAFAWHALGREIRSAAENADQLIAMHERRRLREPDH